MPERCPPRRYMHQLCGRTCLHSVSWARLLPARISGLACSACGVHLALRAPLGSRAHTSYLCCFLLSHVRSDDLAAHSLRLSVSFCAARARGNERASAQGPDVAARRQLVGNRAERDATVARKGPQEARICQHVAAQDIQRALDAKNEGWRLDGAFGAALPLFLRARHRSRHPRCHAGRHGSRQNLGGCLRPAIQGHFGSISQHWYPPSRPATALAWMLQCSSAHCSTRPSPRTTTA